VTSRLHELAYRQAVADDAPRLAGLAVAGFETYRSFGPAGWRPPTVAEEVERVRATLAKPSIWCRVADDGAGLAGHAGFMASEHARFPERPPELAHLWQLFIRRDWWGGGLAAVLLAAAVVAAAEREFEVMRLFTPAGQARARRFYEREGWTQRGGPQHAPAFGMAVVEYRRVLR